MRTQRMLISVLVSALIAFAMESVATADVAMIPNAKASGSFGMSHDAQVRERLGCRQPIPHQIRENLAPGMQPNRAYLDSARPDPGWNLPPGELKMPNIFPLVRIPLDRTIRRPLTPHADPPLANEQTSQVPDLAGDALDLRLADPLTNELC